MKPVKMTAIELKQNSSNETEENVSYVYEDISKMKKFHTTESYYTSSVSYSIPQQITYLLKQTTESIIQEYSTKLSDEVNQLNLKNLITDYFSPLIQFTLPSLPQFGIRMVSADVTSPKTDVKKIYTTTKTITSTSKMTKVSKDNNKNIPSINKNQISKLITKMPILKSTNTIDIKNLPTTTTNIENFSSGGLYGDDIDYYDSSLSKVTDINEKKGSIYDYDWFSKSLITNITNTSKNLDKTNYSSNIDVSTILQRVLSEELKLMKEARKKNGSQYTPMEFRRMFFPHDYSDNSNELNNQFKNIDNNKNHGYISDSIPPYYAFEAPLKVELLDDGSGVSLAPILPVSRNLNQNNNLEIKNNFESKSQITDKNSNFFEIQSKQFNPYDKESMLQLGRFIKNMFVGKNPNLETVEFNLIPSKNLPESLMQEQNNESLIEKNYIQRDTKAQNKNYYITTTFQPIDDKNFTKEIFTSFGPYRIPRMSSDLNIDTNDNNDNNENYNINQKNNDKNIDKSLFNIFKDLVKGIRIDIKESELKTYVDKFVNEKLPNIKDNNFDKELETSWHKSFKNILNSMNGTSIIFHGEKVQLRLGSFSYKKKLQPKFMLVNPIQIQETKINRKLNNQKKIKSFVNDSFDKDEKLQISHNNDEINDDQKIKNSWILKDTNTELEENYSKGTIDIPLNKTQYNKNRKLSRNKFNIKRKKSKNTTDREKLNIVEEENLFTENLSRKFLPSEKWSIQSSNTKENIYNEKNYVDNDESLKNGNKLIKKSINEVNGENPFPDFPIINFDMKRAEDSIDNGFDTIRVSRAAKKDDIKDKSSIVSVYIVMKHEKKKNNKINSIPILELHVRMPANSNYQNQENDIYSKTRSISNSKIPNEIFKISQNLKKSTTEESKINDNLQLTRNLLNKTQNFQKLQKPKIIKRKKIKNQNRLKETNLRYEKNHTIPNLEKANDFIKKMIDNVTNSKSIPDLKKKRQLLYLALKYLRHVTDERLKKRSDNDNNNNHNLNIKENDEKKEIKQYPRSTNKMFKKIQNSWQPMIYPGLENRPMIFNPIENELNSRNGLFNHMPNYNYNTMRYDEMPYRFINPRIRRSTELQNNDKSRFFFINHHRELNRN